MEDKFKFGEMKQKIEHMKRELPIVLANQAQNYFVDSWQRQGWDGTGWRDVKRHDQTTPEFKYPIGLQARKVSSPILVGVYRGISGGTLRAAVGNSIVSQTFNSIRLRVDLPYAKAQNEGTDDIPGRRFMGNSQILQPQQREKIKEYMGGLWGK